MDVISRLRQDHDAFRAQLVALEAALERKAESWRIWQGVGGALFRHLSTHLQCEGSTVAAYARRLGVLDAETLKTCAIDHEEAWRLLRCANEYVAQVTAASDAYVRVVLAKAVAAFRVSMNEQEAELFPWINRVFGVQEHAEDILVAPNVLVETMTANQVVRLYPETRAVFEQLSVNIAYEGYRGLNELAWHLGIETRTLLMRLETEITHHQAPYAPYGVEILHEEGARAAA